MQKSSFSDDAGQSIPGKLSLTHTCTIRAFDLIYAMKSNQADSFCM